MPTIKYKEAAEARLFSEFADFLIEDLTRSGLVSHLSNPLSWSRRFVHFYDPAYEEYISRVDAWQKLLCGTTVPGDWEHLCSLPLGLLLEAGVVRRTPGFDITIEDADPYMIKALHVIVRLFFKYEGKARKETDLEAVKFRLSHPNHVVREHPTKGPLMFSTFTASTIVLDGIREELSYLRPPESWDSLRGRFGPGVACDAASAWGKWFGQGQILLRQPMLLDLLHLPTNDVLFPSKGFKHRRLLSANRFTYYGATRIAEVPKSLKSTRVVSSEPANSMFCQLAIGDYLLETCERVFPEHTNVRHQDVHSELLKQKGYTSIDLSDASDHVSCKLVSLLLPDWKPWLFPVRSRFAEFPDGERILLRTFAPMGSGSTFFVLDTILKGVCLFVERLTGRRCRNMGDDIICHVFDYHMVVKLLNQLGLVVNTEKSCPRGIYREACGREFFASVDVSPCYIRKDPHKADSRTIEAYIARLNNGWHKGIFVATAAHMVSYLNLSERRWNCKLQRSEIKTDVMTNRPRYSRAPSGSEAFRRWLTIAKGPTFIDRDDPDFHLPNLLEQTCPEGEVARNHAGFKVLYTPWDQISDRRLSRTVRTLNWVAERDIPHVTEIWFSNNHTQPKEAENGQSRIQD